MNFYISDLHLGDERVFALCRRPFSSLDEMESAFVKRWNEKVACDDDVYILGDLGNGSAEKIAAFFSKVKGKKHLIVGNHDEDAIEGIASTGLFVSIERLAYVDDCHRKVCVCHYPLMDWFSGKETIYHVYGHIHNKTKENGQMYADIKSYYADKPAFNASADVVGFEPVTLDELIKRKEEHRHDSYIH